MATKKMMFDEEVITDLRITAEHIERIEKSEFAFLLKKCIKATHKLFVDGKYQYMPEKPLIEIVDDPKAKELANVIYNGDFGPIAEGLAMLVAHITNIPLPIIAQYKPKPATLDPKHWGVFAPIAEVDEAECSIGGVVENKYTCWVTTTDAGGHNYRNGYVNITAHEGHKWGWGLRTTVNEYFEGNTPNVRSAHIRPASIDEILAMPIAQLESYVKEKGVSADREALVKARSRLSTTGN